MCHAVVTISITQQEHFVCLRAPTPTAAAVCICGAPCCTATHMFELLSGCCPVLHTLQQRRQVCTSCGVIVGPGYFYFKGVTNRTPPANRYQHVVEHVDPAAAVLQQGAADSAGDEQGAPRREMLHLFIFSESAVVMGAAFQKVFFHVRPLPGCCTRGGGQ